MIFSQLAKRSETWISHSQLPHEVEVDGVESGDMTHTISDVSEACIRDPCTTSIEKGDMYISFTVTFRSGGGWC